MKAVFKILVYVLVISCILMSHAFAESPITVKVDGKEVSFTDAAPFVDANNRTQAPLRAIAEALGCKVEWYGKEQKVIIKKDYTDADTLAMWRSYEGEYVTIYEYSRKLDLTIGSNMKILNFYNSLYGEQSLYSGGYKEQEMDTSPIIKDNRTYLPVRYLAEAFGYEVSWDAVTQTVNIISQNSIDGRYISDEVSSFRSMCAIALYKTDYIAVNRDFANVESAKIIFKDGRVVDVTDNFINATDELKEVFAEVDMGMNVEDIAYAGKVEYDFGLEQNQIFQLHVKVNIADKEGNIGYQSYKFYFDVSDGQGGIL